MTVPDPRSRFGRRYRLASVLAAAVIAVMGGARSYRAITDSVHDLPADITNTLGLPTRTPEESTIRKLFARIDADALDTAIGTWMHTATTPTDGARRIIAIDGKTIRGARTGSGRAPHLIAGLDHLTGIVLAQIAVDDKSNEIPAARTLIAGQPITGAVVTADALHTQTLTAEHILAAGADYVFTVKKNMPSLYQQFQIVDWSTIPARHFREKGHGKRLTRTIRLLDAPAWITFPGARQIAQIRRTVTTGRRGRQRKTIETAYIITSAPFTDADSATLSAWVRGHWSIENRLHWVRDVTFDEDRSQTRTATAPRIMATLRNTAISLLRLHGETNIAAATRHHHRHPDEAAALLLT